MTNADIAHGTILAEQALPIGTVLSGDQFTITGQLGAGGFGITYRAMDNVLGRTIVIKECFPVDFCFREGTSVLARSQSFAKPVHDIVKMFMREARSLAKLRHPNIVGVHRAFEENDTAYMVLDLIDGRDLFDVLKSESMRLSPGRVTDVLMQLLDAIEIVHDSGLLHRDISPDNIILENSGTPVLIDFGAARGDASSHTRAVSSLLVVKDGYSPQEFYVAGAEQTPSSDLYALAATFYHVVSGEAPANSQVRMVEIAGRKPDPCVPLSGRIEGYDDAFLQAIDAAMSLHPSDRLQSAGKWRSLIADCAGDLAPESGGKRASSHDVSLDIELALTQLVEETNEEVRKTSQIPEVSEPVIVPLKEAPKPTWVEEFNQESLSPEPDPVVEDERSGPRIEPKDAKDEDGEKLTYIAPEFIEIGWINRALDDQVRIRSDLETVDGGCTDKAEASASDNGAELPDDRGDGAADEAPAAEVVHRSRFRLSTVILGVVVCLFYLFLSEGLK
ncbi:MAG: serine/threonine protein kinase [Silicimonas sp.]|nr:serine/threonine protein kinase [Silicimonas sp.]